MTSEREPAPPPVSFVWFWSFWHWSTESFRVGESLRNPLQGIAGLWDEWYRHEASVAEQRAIARVGEDVRRQRQFMAWLVRRWAREAQWRGRTPHPRLVFGQLAHLPPFDRWAAMERYRTRYGVDGVHAVVLSEGSAGQPGDVRRVEALAYPADRAAPFPDVVAEGFRAESSELRAMRDAARSVLGGCGALRLIALWIVGGRRPYPHAFSILLSAGWASIVGVIGYLLIVSDPGRTFVVLATLLLALWIPLALIGVGVAAIVSLRTWREGKRLAVMATQVELRLRMQDGLTLVGGSAGLAFTLNAIGAVLRVRHSQEARSWLWEQVHRAMRHRGSMWAATGVVAPNGSVGAVALEPKVRACLAHERVQGLLTPRQRDVARAASARVSDHVPVPLPRYSRTSATGPQLGYAAARRSFRAIGCHHVSDAVMAIGGLSSRRQVMTNVVAVLASAAMLIALPDLGNVVLPPAAPIVVATAGSSPFHLAITLDSPAAEAFAVALESRFWANRRQVLQRTGGVSRANIPLHRLSQRVQWELDDGTLWVERRRGFLFRDYAPGERVGAYSLRYLNQLNR